MKKNLVYHSREDIFTCFQQKPPSYNLILLSMGNDGHTASLFPDTELVKSDLTDQSRLVAGNWVPKLDAWRITFTPCLINAAQNVFFLVSGQKKANTLKLVLEGPSFPELYPSQLIDLDQGNLFWHVEREAAVELPDVSPDSMY